MPRYANQDKRNPQRRADVRNINSHPTTAFILNLSKNPLKSSFRISITHASKLSIRTLAPVSLTTS
jgi:hypothetical protein